MLRDTATAANLDDDYDLEGNPFDDEVKVDVPVKGQTIPKAKLEKTLGHKYGTQEFNLARLRYRATIEARYKTLSYARGGDLVVLTDEQCPEYVLHLIQNNVKKIGKNVRRMTRCINTEFLAPETARRLEFTKSLYSNVYRGILAAVRDGLAGHK